jgi:Txe/YoeB family toxin of Txe-Axe toxin-antitoxin module
MKKTTVLSKRNEKEVITINPETPFFQITHIEILTDLKTKNAKDDLTFRNVDLTLNQMRENDAQWNGLTFFYGAALTSFPPNGIVKINDALVESNEFNRVELVYTNSASDDVEIRIHYETVNNNVSLTDPLEDFKQHIELKDNVKILFSAPFGQGKSTFLNHFFEQNKNQYEVFHVFPVNYSISHNEDVFKYIKAEVLFQLLGKEIDFDKKSFTYSETAWQFFKNNPARILSPMLKLIPKVGKDAYEIYEQLHKLANEYLDYHDKTKIDDRKKTEKFIEELYEKEGSIFEDNFYTQLIRQQLLTLKGTTKKKNVLIIEDMDRMDPEHIFRILNVFAAHFDDADRYDGFTNKFGFDKIIIVADYFNVKNIFSHRYGKEVDFIGYINKYYSRQPYFYDNKNAIAYLINDMKKGFHQNDSSAGIGLFTCVLEDLVSSENLTLRDLLKLLKNDARPIIYGNHIKNKSTRKGFYTSFVGYNLIFYLSKIFDLDSIIYKFEKCKDIVNIDQNWRHDVFVGYLLPSLVLQTPEENKYFNYEYKSMALNFLVTMPYAPITRYGCYQASMIKNASSASENVVFTKRDFYELLILNAKRYKEVEGFK